MQDSARHDAQRRHLLLAGVAAGLPLTAGRVLAAEPEKLRIGFQKSSTLTIFLKSRGTLEKALAPLKVDLQWHEFTSGLPLLEALNIGAVDLSADVADAVPPFALAAGAKLTYYAIETPSPQAQAIVEPAPQLPRATGRRRGAGRTAAHRRRVHAGADPAEARERGRLAGVAAGLIRTGVKRQAAATGCSACSGTVPAGEVHLRP